MSIVFCTLGPEGTCHDNAVKNYIKFQKIQNATINYISDFFIALDYLRQGKIDYIIQNCAHPQVVDLCEKYCQEIFIIDSYIYPTLPMGILYRKDMEETRTLGLMPATRGYIDHSQWDELVYESANPIVGMGLLEGKYSYGITFLEYAERYPDILGVKRDFGGPVDTVWIVYGRKRRCNGEVIGIYNPSLYIR